MTHDEARRLHALLDRGHASIEDARESLRLAERHARSQRVDRARRHAHGDGAAGGHSITARARSLAAHVPVPPGATAARVAPEAGPRPPCASSRVRAPVRPGQDAPGPGCGAHAGVLRGTSSGHASSPSREHLAGPLAGHLYAAPGREPVRTPVAASPGLITRQADGGDSAECPARLKREPGYCLSLTAVRVPQQRTVVSGVFSLAAALIMASPVGSVIWWWGGFRGA